MSSEVHIGITESLNKGDLVRVERDGVYDRSTAMRHVREDGYVYGTVKHDSPTPDGGGDISVHITDSIGTSRGESGYFDAHQLERAIDGPEREIEHQIDEDDEDDGEVSDVLATLDERQSNVLQMEKLAAVTIEPGLFLLPCTVVSTAESNDRWSVEVEHPTKGEIIFHVDKPVEEGWVEGQELVELLEWYDIFDHDPYRLQTKHLHVAYKGNEADTPHGYELVEPPRADKPHPTHWAAFKHRVASLVEERPFDRSVEKSWFLLGLSTVLMALATALMVPSVGAAGFSLMLVIGAVAYTVMTMVTLGATEPPGGD